MAHDSKHNIKLKKGTLFNFARYLAEVKRLQHCNPLSTTLVGLAKVYANDPWLVTESEAVGVPGWYTGTKALCFYSQSP